MAGKLKSGALVTDISVSAYNDMLDMLRWWKQTQRTGAGSGPRGDYNRGVFNGRNDLEFSLDIFSVVGINGPLIAPTYNEQEFKNKSSLKLTVPETPAHDNKFAITLEPCPAGSICKVCVCGMVPVLLDVVNESDEFASIDDSVTSNLITGGSGVPIIWKDAEGGENIAGLRWGLVLLGQADRGYDRITGLTTAAVATSDDTFTIDNVAVVKGADPREDTESSSETVTVYNTHAWEADDNAKVRAEWNETTEHWEAYQVTCPS